MMNEFNPSELRKINISGIVFEMIPYTEKRRADLDAVTADIDDYLDKHKGISFDAIPIDVKSEFWRRKAQILLRPLTPVPKGFWSSDDLEYTRLHDVEFFFRLTRTRL